MKLKAELKDVDRALVFMAAVKKQVPFALATALTRTAQNAKRSIEAEMPRAFDTPTRWTLNSLRLEPARKTKLQAVVAVKDKVSRGNPALFWMAPEVHGGTRADKRSEMALKKMGALPNGMQAAIGRDVRTNRFGNLTKGHINEAIKGAKMTVDGGKSDNDHFLIKRGKGAAGKYFGVMRRESRRGLVMVLPFVPPAKYRLRLDFYGVGQKAVDRTFSAEVTKSLEQAIRAAK